MNERDIKLRIDAHSLAGFLKGLRDGVQHWKAGEVDEDMLDRLRKSLDQASLRAGWIVMNLSEDK